MKYLLITVLFLGIVSSAFADEIKITITNTETNVILKEVTISKDEVRAVEYYVLDFPQWIIDTTVNKVKLRIDAFVAELTDKNVNKLTDAEKKAEVKKAVVQSRKERETK